MKTGIVSNSADILLPLLAELYRRKAVVEVYYGKSADSLSHQQQVLDFCHSAGIGVTVENTAADLYSWQQMCLPDLIFFAGYAHIADLTRLTAPGGIFNIHYSLLPAFRGPSPVFWQLKTGAADVGLSIHRLTAKTDSGPLVWQYRLSNQPYMTFDYLQQVCQQLQVQGLCQVLDTLTKGEVLNEMPQDESQASYYSRPVLKDVLIDWERLPALQILDLIKACSSWNSGAVSFMHQTEIKLLDAIAGPLAPVSLPPGTLSLENDQLAVHTCDGKLLHILYLKIDNQVCPARFAGVYGLQSGQCLGVLADMQLV